MTAQVTIALAGNPNSGKTTLFNRLTGLRQHVGNYPGVTVEKSEGTFTHHGVEIRVVDLPGTYSLTAFSIEERVSRRYLMDDCPHVVVDVVDASNLERSLYLAVQIMELHVPMVLAFNMSDVARARGIEMDLPKLSGLLGVPIVATIARTGEGMDVLVDQALALAGDGPAGPAIPMAGHQAGLETGPARQVPYGPEIEEEIEHIVAALEVACHQSPGRAGLRWLAVKLLEGDEEARRFVTDPRALAQTDRSIRHLQGIFGESPEIVLAGRRYGFISGACQEAVRSTVEARHTVSDKIDAVLTHPVVGLPIFLAMMYLAFQLTFTLGRYPMGWLERLFAWLAGTVQALLPTGPGVGGALGSLLVDGVIGGVGGVISFLPNILLLFLAVAVLEDSGYMARAAFLMDRLMHRIGLHGKSFIPMLIGFGCTVPAIMATRTLDSRRDRLVTMMILPLMSCGARLTIYALFIPAFFPPAWQGPVLWGIYLVGIVLAIACAKLLGKTILRGEAPAFVMELPLYRLPTLRGLAIHAWDRGWLYLRKAGTVILGISIVLWALASYPKKQVYDRDYDAQAAAARTTLEADVRSMNLELGLPAESYELPWALRGLEYRARHGDPITPADRRKAADEAQDHASGNPASRPGEQRAVAFLHACAAIDEARARFAGIPPAQGSQSDAQSLALSHLRDQGLADIARSSGPAYPAALRYLDEIEPAYVGQLHDLRNLRRAEELSYSVAGRIGHGLEPALRPLGFDWRIGTALVGAAAAKEVFVAQMGIVFAVGEGREQRDALRSQIQEHYTPLQGLCVMLFCLIGMPCMATVAVTWKESGGKRWAALQLAGLTALAYVVTLVVYQFGRLLT